MLLSKLEDADGAQRNEAGGEEKTPLVLTSASESSTTNHTPTEEKEKKKEFLRFRNKPFSERCKGS